MPDSALVDTWRSAFRVQIRDHARSAALRTASERGSYAEWTRQMTAIVVASCRAMGWDAAARGHRLARFPVPADEYLALDVTAFPASPAGQWVLPVAVFELENYDATRMAYSLWKVVSVRAQLRVVVCYSDLSAQAGATVRALNEGVVHALRPALQSDAAADTLVIVGSRDRIELFPDGFFQWWWLEPSRGRLTLMA